MHDLVLDILIDIFGEPIKSYPRKNQYCFDCPICAHRKGMPDGDGKGNLEVNISKGLFNCWACGAEGEGNHGTIIKLLKKFGNDRHLKEFRLLIPDFEFETPQVEKKVKDVELPDEFIPFDTANENSIAYKEAMDYLKNSRGFTKELVTNYNMGFAEEGKYKHRVILPSYDRDGNLNYFTARSFVNDNIPYKNPPSDKVPKESIIFNEYGINWDSTIYLVEGPFDSLVVPNAIPLMGKKLYDLLYDRIMEKACGYLVVALDYEAWRESIEIYSKLNVGELEGKVRIIKLPEKYDFNDIYAQWGEEGVIKLMSRARRLKPTEL